MQTVGVGQEAIVIKLNETIDALRRDLILKDEIIKKLESGQSKDTVVEKKAEKPAADQAGDPKPVSPSLLQRPTVTTTKSAVVAAPAAGNSL